jgi:hypothetical protein
LDKLVLLKTQLVEAAKFAKSKRFSHKRLSVILLDNFIEIQLSDLIRQKFRWDGAFYFVQKKYSQEKRNKILNHYDELLKACVKENEISASEQRLLIFCHNIRNNLYHKGKEEVLLTQIVINILQEIIIKHQPIWKNTRGLTVLSHSEKDPYPTKRTGKTLTFFENEESSWINFLNKYFICIDRRRRNSSQLLSDYLIEKLRSINNALSFIKTDYANMFPESKSWNYNDYLLHYSFLNLKHIEIEKIKENSNRKQIKNQLDQLFLTYQKKWSTKKPERLKILKNSSRQLSKLPIEKSIIKFTNLNDEIIMIYEAFSYAAGELDGAIQDAYDRYRGK